MGKIRIGVSGWSYDHWRDGVFYPDGLPRRRELEYATRRFNSLEINGSFYSLLRPDTYRKYAGTAPDGFVFAVKGSRFITHSKKLKDPRTPLANFFASGLLRLEEKLGPVLWQLPDMSWDLERTRRFLELLPKDTRDASRLARKHDQRVNGRASMVVHRNRRIRYALEPRDPDFFCEEGARVCRNAGVAMAFADSGDWPYTEELTAGFVYLRLHGSPRTYASDYGPRRLESFAEKIRAWKGGEEPPDPARLTERVPPRRKERDVYVYFDNDAEGHAPHDARALMKVLGVREPEPWEG